MAGAVSGMGTTFNLPNYHGQLFALTPTDTPLLSAIGGLTGGGQTDSAEFEWQTYDVRDPAQRTQVEGATAPTAAARVRGNVRNVCEIHQEKVSISYTKQAAIGQFAVPSGPPDRGVGGSNPVTNELNWQIGIALKQIAIDVNYSFINGVYQLPTDNTTPRKTRGLLAAITTNVVDKSTSTVTGLSSATDTITETATGLSNGDQIIFTKTGDMTNVVAGRTYYVVSKATNSFKVAKTAGGTALTLGTSTSNVDYKKPWGTALAVTDLDALAQMAFDNGGLGSQPTFLVNSAQKRAISAAYAAAYGKASPIQGKVGGVTVDQVLTDFGLFNIMVDRHVPQDAIIVASLGDLRPVFLNVPGKGVFFEEPLAKTGASDEVQIYGEIGLEYGPESHHAVMRGLDV